MLIRSLFPILLTIMAAISVNAQIYHFDSLKIEIEARNNFLVKSYDDLDISILYTCVRESKGALVYQRLQNYHRTTFGNCYFELYKYDSAFGGYKDITDSLNQGSHHPPGEFESREEILKYDVEKTELKPGQQRILTFNLLNFVSTLSTGDYSLKVYIRFANTYGYSRDGSIIATSVQYLESAGIGFSVLKDIDAPKRGFAN